MKFLFFSFIVLSVAFSGCQNHQYQVKQLRTAEADEEELVTKFYKKVTKVQGILIASSEHVSDYAHRETAYLFDKMMLDLRPDIADRIRKAKVLCILVAHDELTNDVPQFHKDLKGKELDFYNWRSRGFLTRLDGRSIVFFAEEDVLEYESGNKLESILIHEFGHVVHHVGFDKKLHQALKKSFKNTKKTKLWMDGRAALKVTRIKSEEPVSLLDELVKYYPKIPRELFVKCLDNGDIKINGEKKDKNVKVSKKDKIFVEFGGDRICYACKNINEYFAEGFQTWYDTNRVNDHDHNHVYRRDQLKKYDPMLAAICKEVQGDGEWRFIRPTLRAGKDHLNGFDPSIVPAQKTPEHLKEAARNFFDKLWEQYWFRLADKYKIKIGYERAKKKGKKKKKKK